MPPCATEGERILANCANRRGYSATSCLSSRPGYVLMPKTDLDAIDRRIVASLQADGRLSNIDLAERVGLSPSPCLRRGKRLRGAGKLLQRQDARQRDADGRSLW